MIFFLIMVRTIIIPNEPEINLPIPVEYIGEEIEILAYPVKGIVNSNKFSDNSNFKDRPIPVFGCLKGQIQMTDDFDEPLDDFKEYM